MSDEMILKYGILLIAVGLVLVILLVLLLVLRRRNAAKRPLRPGATSSAQPHMMDAEDRGEAVSPDETPAFEDAAAQTNSGFTLFRKKGGGKKAAAQSTPDTATAAQEVDPAKLAALADIEQQMLALRELFRNGEITRTVYIAESKALYEQAQLLRS